MDGATTRSLERRALAPLHLLQFERVAVRIGEVCSFDAAAEVVNFADLYTSSEELGARLGDVLHNQVHASNAARFSRIHIQPGPKTDRTTRALWCELDDPDALTWVHVKVLLEAERVGIEGDGSIHIRNWEWDQFQLHLHRIRTPSACLVRAIIPYSRQHPHLAALSRGQRNTFFVIDEGGCGGSWLCAVGLATDGCDLGSAAGWACGEACCARDGFVDGNCPHVLVALRRDPADTAAPTAGPVVAARTRRNLAWVSGRLVTSIDRGGAWPRAVDDQP